MAIPVDSRRQSGLWSHNPNTGIYEKHQQPPGGGAGGGPYQYYQPPPARSSSDGKTHRRTFSDRSGNSTISDAYIAATQNKVGGAGNILDKGKIKELALATHSKIAASLHAYSGDSKSEDFARSGHAAAVHSPDQPVPRARNLFAENARRNEEQGDTDVVPENLRTTAWSPEGTQEQQISQPKSRQASTASDGLFRRGSVPDRSPLQKLQGTLDEVSKEQKRAKLEEAEGRARRSSSGGEPQRSNTLRSEKGRVVSDGSRRSGQSNSDKYYRQVSAGAPQALPPDYGPSRFRRASDALSNESPPVAEAHGGMPERQRSAGQPPSNANPRYYAPEARRSSAGAQPRGATQTQPDVPHNANQMGREGGSRSISGPGSTDLERTASGKYKHRLRDAGFAGAATAAAGAAGYGAYEASAAARGKAAYENRRRQEAQQPPETTNVGRSGSRKLQKRFPEEWNARRGSQDQASGSMDSYRGKQMLQTDRMGTGDVNDRTIPPAGQDPDPIPRAAVATNEAVSYSIPPQTAAAQAAKGQVGFENDRTASAGFSSDQTQRGYGAEASPVHAQPQDKHHHFGGLFHRHGDEASRRGYVAQKPLEDWKGAKPVRLELEDLEFPRDAVNNSTWWEEERSHRRGSNSGAAKAVPQFDGPYEEEAKSFRPPLFLKCGPLLRYTGIRKEPSPNGRGEREIWRGSIMIVTEDDQSDYSSAPTLRIFAQPMDLSKPPPKHMMETGQELPPEFEDPVAGQVKISRTGRPLYVRPVHEIEGGIDLSREENNQGLYAATRTPMLGPQFSSTEARNSPHITFQDKSRIKGLNGEQAGRSKEVRAIRLHHERGFTFWRWSLEIELGSTQHRVAYRINKGPALGFWVPPRGEGMNVMFHSCNGFSLSVDPDQFSGPDPLWRDVLNRHQSRPFHVMIGGGDQIYNDAAMRDTTLFREWLQSKNPEAKHNAEFTPELQEELENFYFNRYSMWFSQGLFAMAGSQIPMVNIWDDHDIIDGFGSYPHHFMSTKIFAGLGAVAFKYYMLFQHQSVNAETTKEEPSWVLGASPGPYINELSRSVFLNLGRKVAFLGIDCRTERMRDEVLSQESYDILFDRARSEINKGETKHLLVLLGVPIAYPRLNFLENILTSRAMDPIKAIGRTGMLGGFVKKFDGGVEILDDLDDHWTAKHHKAERNWFIQELQELAAEKSVRVTILAGDVHLGAVGQFYTPRKTGVSKDRDHRYIPNVISSAIVNTPPPPMMADVLNKRNKVHHLDSETDEDLIPMFETDVDGSKRNNKCLLPRRNYCTIREFAPGSTPPPSPPPETEGPGFNDPFEREPRDRRYPPGSMSRTRSLTRGPANLIRRLSGSSRSRNPPVSMGQGPGMGRSNSLGGSMPASGRGSIDAGSEPPQRPTNTFMRRPTNLSEKEVRRAISKGGAPDEEESGAAPGHIDLESGLDISLNMEVDQLDPSGMTQGYRLLVPALWYEGMPDINDAPFKSRRASFMDHFRGNRRREEEEEEEEDVDDYSDLETITPTSTAAAPTAATVGRVPRKPVPGYDGPSPRQSTDNEHGAAYTQGYNLTAPPLGPQSRGGGVGGPPPDVNKPLPNNPYPSQAHRASVPEPSESTFASSEDFGEVEPPPRRFSKAERFFGIGEEGGARPEKAKPKWKIWR